MSKWVLVMVLLLLPAAAWWDPDWNFSKPLTPDGNASLITGWFTLDTAGLISNGQVQPDCDDLRVISGQAVDHFVSGCNTTHTSVFFEVDYTGDGYELYYGSPSAGDRTTSGVFDFYDGFGGYSSGEDGSPTWTTRAGSFQVNYTNKSWRYVLNSSSESIATAYSPSGNFSVFAVLNDPGEGHPGVVYSYVNSTHYYAAYINGSSLWVRNGTSSHEVAGSSVASGFNYLLVEVINGQADIYLNTPEGGSATATGEAYSPGEAGVYAAPSGSHLASVDDFAVFPSAGVGWSLGSRDTRPRLVLRFVGSEAANMRTAVAPMSEGESTLRIQLEPDQTDDIVVDQSAQLAWGNVTFNSTGYAVNGSFVQIEADRFNFTNGKYRFDLHYMDTNAARRKWHSIQFFYDFPAVKHVVFVTAAQDGNYSAAMRPWTTCSGYVNNSGESSCHSHMHASTGVFHLGSGDVCGLNWGSSSPLRLHGNVSVEAQDYGKLVFWHSFTGCDKFMEKTELLCGTDFHNCTATAYRPVRTLFYVNNEPGPLARVEHTPGFSCKVNGKRVQELADSSRINKGLNDLECSGTGNLSYFRLYTANPYEASRFFGEKPEVHRVTIRGPASRGKLGTCGIPVFGRILPHTCSGSSLFFEGDFLNGTQDFYLFRTDRSWSYTGAEGGAAVPVEITPVMPPQPPLAAAKELGTPIIPPTHDVVTSRRLFYANHTTTEVVITAWQSI